MVEFNLETLSLTTLFEGMQADIEEFLWDPQLDRPVVGVSYPARHQYHYAPGDSDTARWHRMLAASFDGQNVILESHSKDRKRILLHVSSDALNAVCIHRKRWGTGARLCDAAKRSQRR